MRTVIIMITMAFSFAEKKEKMKCCNMTSLDSFCESEVLIFAKVLKSPNYHNNSILHEYEVNESYILKDKTGTVSNVSGIDSIFVVNTPCSRPFRTDYYLIGGRLVPSKSLFLDECGFFVSDRMIRRSERRQKFLEKIAKDENLCERRKHNLVQ